MKAIISGGGTGGHIFPAVAIAKAIRKKDPNAEILFVGAIGRMEMEKVPQQGFEIIGLPISGIQRRLTWKNLLVPVKVIRSLIKARMIVRNFKPDIAVGVGGYASGPLLKAATAMGIPSLIQEQNSFAGITNKLLAKRVNKICVAYEGMDRFFPAHKIEITGNPVRPELKNIVLTKEEACHHFGLDHSKPVIAAVGGSLGAASINQAVQYFAPFWVEKGWQIIWQTGKNFDVDPLIAQLPGVVISPFIIEMNMLYAASDLVISRAGAMSIAELCAVGKPAVLVPSPHVAEDHQTHNALALVRKEAAVLIKDHEIMVELGKCVGNLIQNDSLRAQLASNAHLMGVFDADERIADIVFELARKI